MFRVGDIVRHRRINWLTRERTYTLGMVVEVLSSPRDIVGDYRVVFVDGANCYVLGTALEPIGKDI